MSETQSSKPTKNLAEALAECKDFAKRGETLAQDSVSLLERVINKVSEKLQEEIKILEKSNFKDEEISEKLKSQLSEINGNFKILPQILTDNINNLSKKPFSISIFGRTLSGKSTLMEILTHGKGDSIGKGAQRTTRDVHHYLYKDMEITDMPGISDFDGEDEEAVAFEAAKNSDLILFLITDDAPQASEAECLNKILELGKPVICMINIKAGTEPATDLKMLKRDILKKFDDTQRLDALKKQFFAFGEKYGQDWSKLRFVCAHLKSAFLSQQGNFSQADKDELYGLSKFKDVENLIIKEICEKGSFYKFKNFIDIVSVPLIYVYECLLCQSVENGKQGFCLEKNGGEKEKLTNDFKSLKESFLALSDAQYNVAMELNKILEEMNMAIIKEALAYTGYKDLESRISRVARIPGYAIMLVLEHDNSLPDDAVNALKNLLKEKVWCIVKNDDIRLMLLQAIWDKAESAAVEAQDISLKNIDGNSQIAQIPFLDNIDANTKIRVRLAQQITGLLITL
jgi:hypothetical protein